MVKIAREIFIKHIVLILSAVIILFGTLNFVKMNFGTDIYNAEDFRSGYTEKDEKIITDGDAVIFTYGPYISLKKGEYSLKIYYQCDFDNGYDISSDFGGVIVNDGVLPAGSDYVETFFTLEEDALDNGIEIRTKYKGAGTFELKSVELSRNFVAAEEIIAIVVFIAAAAVFMALLYLFKEKQEEIKIVFFWFALNYVLFYGYMVKNLHNLTISAILLAILTVSVFISKEKLLKFVKEVRAEEILCIVLFSYIGASLVLLFSNETSASLIDFIKNTALKDVLYNTAFIFDIFLIYRLLKNKSFSSYRILLFSVFLFGGMVLFECGQNLYLTIGVITILAYFVYYLFDKERFSVKNLEISHKAAFCVLFVAFIAVFLTLAWNNICRYRLFYYQAFDSGIFFQMFENMAKSGIPVTTCERNELISHFYIHFSPIYYIILPLYMIFRNPEVLLVVQAFAVSSVVFPVFMLCKKHKLSGLMTVAVGLVSLFLPAFVCSLYWGFHENKFLAVFILWFIYFMEEKKNIGTFIFMALILMIKEDAALYIICVCMYYFAKKKEVKRTFAVLASSLVYFVVVMIFIQSGGESLMSAHYGAYYLPGQEGTWDLLHNIISNPTFFIKNNFTEETFPYILYVMTPLLFVPLAAGNFKRFILLIPLVIMNLMTPYKYQHDVFFQYSYGSSALLLFMFILNIKDKPDKFKYVICLTAVFASFFMTYARMGEGLISPSREYDENREAFDYYEEALRENIPEEASVAASGSIPTHLYNHAEMYLYEENFDLEKYNVDYLVFDVSDVFDMDEIKEQGYDEEYRDDKFVIYKKFD